MEPSEAFERFRVLEEDPFARAATGADHDRGRRRQAERTGAGDHEDRDGRFERATRVAPEPEAERRRRDDEHDRHESRGPEIGQPLRRGLRALRLADHPDDLREHGVVARAVEPDGQRAHAVDGPADHPVAGLLVHREAFAGHHRLIGGAHAVDDDAVGREALARFQQPLVARLEVAPRRELEERFDRAAGAAPGPLLEQPAEEDDRDDRRGGVVVGHRDERTREERGVGAERDQRVHVGREMADRPQEAGMERPPRPELDRRSERHPEPVRSDVEHGERHHGGGEDDRDAGADGEVADLVVVLVDLLGLGGKALRAEEPGDVDVGQ
jgi:hypothetical protein